MSRFISQANTTTPARRTWSLVSSTPSRREATTKSAVPSTSGSSMTAHLGRVVLAVGVEGDHVAGPPVDAEAVADPEGHPVAEVGREDTGRWRPHRATTLAVPSSPPSTTTSGVTASPHASAGTAFSTSPMLSASS